MFCYHSLEFFLNSMLDSRETRGINDQDNIMQYSLRSISSKEFNHNKCFIIYNNFCTTYYLGYLVTNANCCPEYLLYQKVYMRSLNS